MPNEAVQRAERDYRVDRALRSLVDSRYEQRLRSNGLGAAQPGGRAEVTGAKHLDGVERLVQEELEAAGAHDLTFLKNRSATLPGYFRPTKSWDLLVKQGNEPILAVEYKTIGSSYAKNLNNRADEVFGVAEDLRLAAPARGIGAGMRRAYVFVAIGDQSLENASPRPLARTAVGEVDPVFSGASVMQRIAIMCARMREQELYHLTWVVHVTPQPFDWSDEFAVHDPEVENSDVSWKSFSRGLADIFDDEGRVVPLPLKHR